MTRTSPQVTAGAFHAGERAIQERLGVRDVMARVAQQMIRSALPEQHRAFYAALPYVVAAARDAAGRPWVTLLTGRPGFLRSDDPQRLRVGALPPSGDALHGAFRVGADVGLLGIELDTRRRNRINGTIVGAGDGVELEVGQAFGNCPQHITERDWRTAPQKAGSARAVHARSLTPEMQRLVGSADTFFIGTGYGGSDEAASQGMDASHRGGVPGFVQVEAANRLVFPDYSGNNHFNTLGNLLLDARVGLLFVDFERGGLLQVTGRAVIDWDSSAVAAHPGARRLVVVEIDAVVWREQALPIRFIRSAQEARALRVVEKRAESNDVTSFYLAPQDGGALPKFQGGQHLPIAVKLPGADLATVRTYSLSGKPGDDHYRVSVKRHPDGLVSRYLHDHVEVGNVLKASPPAGMFGRVEPERPVVLLSAGVGVTPMVSLLHALTETPSERPIAFVHQARDGRHHPFAEEVAAIAARSANVTLRVAYSRPRPEDAGRFDRAGRIDATWLQSLPGSAQAQYCVCGPERFQADMVSLLTRLGIAADAIQVEAF